MNAITGFRRAIVCGLAAVVLFGVALRPAAAQTPQTQAQAQPQAQLLQQVQAADVLSNLITWYGDRTLSRVDAMRDYLKQKNLLNAYERQTTPIAPPRRLAYDQIFRGAVQFIQQGGSNYADPSLTKLTEPRLRTELAALQSYNLRQYLDLGGQCDTANSMRIFLQQQGQYQGYLNWAGAQLRQIEATTTHPATNPAQVAVRMEQVPPQIKEDAWKRAQAQGMSRDAFEQQWKQRQDLLRRSVADRVQANAALAQALQQQNPGSEPQAQPAAGQTGLQARQDTNIVIPSPDSGTNSQFASAPINWTDNYADVYQTQPYSEGGIYRPYDTRTDQNWDQSVNTERDRRVNAGFDRRSNVRIDIHQNY